MLLIYGMARPKQLKQPQPISLRLNAEMETTLIEASRRTGLSKSDVARLSIERGLSILLKQLETPVAEAA
jgi:hypothetical protein